MGVDVPVDLPDCGGKLIQQFGLFDQIAELSSEDYRESFDGEEEIDSGGMPRAIGGTDGATGNDVVNVGMILQSSAPGMEYAEEAGEVGADMLGIGGEFFDGVGRSLEQSGVAKALVLADERAQLLWDGKSDQEVVARELALDAGL